MRKIHVLLAISPFFLMTAHAEETQMTDPKTIEQQLAFTCVHEKAKLPPLNPEADQLYRYARWLAQNQEELRQRNKAQAEGYAQIARYYRIAWAHGHYKANVELVNMLSNESIADPNLASTLLKLADGLIAMGVPGGYYDMGRYIQRGLGVKRDPDLANRFYRKAADLGNPEAQFFIGENLRNLGIRNYPVPYAIGYKMIACAADQGHANAALKYAIHLKNAGKYPEALKYLQIAVKGGLSVAASGLRDAFLAPDKDSVKYLALAKDEERSRRYEIIGFQTLAERDYLKPTVPELDEIVPLPPAKLPKWNGSTKWLDDFKAGKPPVPQPSEELVARLAAEKGLDPATGLLLAEAHKRKMSSLTPPSAAALALGTVCKTGQACPESGVWQVIWSPNSVEHTEREAAAPDAYPQDFYDFSKVDVFPEMPFRLKWSDWRIDTLPVKWRLAAYPFVEVAKAEPAAPEPERKPVRLHISTTCKTGEVCGQKGIWQALWPSGTVEHTSRSAVKLAQVPVDFPQDFYTFEAGDVFPKMPLTYERSTWAIHKTPITWQLVAYQPNETYKHSTVYVEVDEPENTKPAEHPMQGRRFTSGDACLCDADYRPLPYAEHHEVLESKRHIKKGEIFPEMMVRHTKPREVIIKTGLFSKKTVQEFDYLDKVVWRLHPDEIDNYRG